EDRPRSALNAIALLARDEEDLATRRQIFERGWILKDGVLGDVERQPFIGLGIGQQDGGNARELVRRAGCQRLARPVCKAPMAFLGGLGSKRSAALAVGRKNTQMMD